MNRFWNFVVFKRNINRNVGHVNKKLTDDSSAEDMTPPHPLFFVLLFFIFLHLKPAMEFTAQVNAMQHLKDQLEQRTLMIQNNIQRQQEELRQIQEQLQKVQGQGIQVGGEHSLPESSTRQQMCQAFPSSANVGLIWFSKQDV